MDIQLWFFSVDYITSLSKFGLNLINESLWQSLDNALIFEKLQKILQNSFMKNHYERQCIKIA